LRVELMSLSSRNLAKLDHSMAQERTCAILDKLADLAVRALIEEAQLTPKPALVDRRGSGAHKDLTLSLMEKSARALHPIFREMAYCASGREINRSLREDLAFIGRKGETLMLAAAGGSNAHRGAIWAIGLLVAATAIAESRTINTICSLAGRIAKLPDRFVPAAPSHGQSVAARFGVLGARGEALEGFPHVRSVGITALRSAQQRGIEVQFARLDALLSIMTMLDDTCLLHRGGLPALDAAKKGAHRVLEAGGSSQNEGMKQLLCLHKTLMKFNASPGGAADLLAATIFLDWVEVQLL